MTPALPIPCDDCAAPCCHHYTVFLDGYDAHRIARALVLPPEDFLELSFTDEVDERFRILLDGEPPRDRRRWYRLQLRRVPDAVMNQRCIFLLTVGERGRCGIYGVRPGICALYPTSDDGDAGIGLNGGGRFCPPDSWKLEMIDVPLHRVRHREAEARKRVYDALVDGWNRCVEREGRVRGKGEFYQFLVEAYDYLEGDGLAAVERALRRMGVGE